jgi:hypothetical protein
MSKKTNTPSTSSETPERLIPLSRWNDYHDWPPVGGMRHIRFNAKKKQAAHCFVKKGSLVLVRERTFLVWASLSDAA